MIQPIIITTKTDTISKNTHKLVMTLGFAGAIVTFTTVVVNIHGLVIVLCIWGCTLGVPVGGTAVGVWSLLMGRLCCMTLVSYVHLCTGSFLFD